ncbi:dienelactone hydrolase [Mrakia frigida]|uniref:dienelactone hydrolase family protein n=1 Tax=Mrakia frigida TaxID=29902 RepID=UPI003FCC119B
MTTEIKDCCISGTLHSGIPTGLTSTLHGLPTYIASPEGGNKEKTVVWVSDIFGWELVNTRLVADEWAKQGWYVLLPDVLGGSVVPHELLNAIVPNLREQESQTVVEKAANTVKATASYGPWSIAHRDAVTVPIVRGFIEAVKKDEGVKKLVAVGTCFGGRHAILAGGEGSVLDAVVAYHPAGLTLPDELTALTVPTLIAVGDKDAFMSTSQIDEAIKIFNERKEKNASKGLEIKVYPNAVHGFAVRGDQTVEEERKQKEEGFKDAINFLSRVLG